MYKPPHISPAKERLEARFQAQVASTQTLKENHRAPSPVRTIKPLGRQQHLRASSLSNSKSVSASFYQKSKVEQSIDMGKINELFKEVGHIKRLMVNSKDNSKTIDIGRTFTEETDPGEDTRPTSRQRHRAVRKRSPSRNNPEVQNLNERVAYYKNLYEQTLAKLSKSRESNKGRQKADAKKEKKIKQLQAKCNVAEKELDNFRENYTRMIEEMDGINEILEMQVDDYAQQMDTEDFTQGLITIDEDDLGYTYTNEAEDAQLEQLRLDTQAESSIHETEEKFEPPVLASIENLRLKIVHADKQAEKVLCQMEQM